MKFDPEDPYPLIDLASVPYEEQKIHAAQVDAWLGFDVERVESMIERASAPREQIREQWIGLAPQSLQTPYVELRRMLHEVGQMRALGDGAKILDIGAAYGRLAFVVAAHLPGAHFVGLEISPERVREGARVIQKHGLKNGQLLQADVLSYELPQADVYFMYDFGSLRSIQTLLQKLKERARSHPLTLVGRGRATRDEIERRHPWLSQVVEPRHHGNFSIYSTRSL